MSSEVEPHLVGCPFCGAHDGYKLAEGETYRWWTVHCKACGAIVTDCRSEVRAHFDATLPDSWPPADEAWNEAGKHAEALREALKQSPLPPYAEQFAPRWPNDEPGYTADQMLAYAARRVAAERERWARVAREMFRVDDLYGAGYYNHPGWAEAYAKLRQMVGA